jgi:flavin-dependent dehydrogenase
MPSFDIRVIGGGPAGATAALLLARAGRKVALVEKAAFPRRKVCGEYIAPPAASFLRSIGVEFESEVRRIAVWAGSRSLQAPLPAPYASTFARESLDSLLLEKAVEVGTVVFQPLKATSLSRTPTGFVCESIEARAVIAAHGSWEPGALPTQARRPAPRASDLLAFKAHFHGAAFARDTIALIPFSGGYGGALMLGDGRATFACCIRRDALEQLRQPGMSAGESVFLHAQDASAELRKCFEKARPEGVWLASGPLRPGVRQPYRDGIYAVGNAAGEVHPIIGQGISLAVQSAALLSATFDLPHAYERECRKLYSRALWPSSLLVRLTPHARAPWMLSLGAKLVAA